MIWGHQENFLMLQNIGYGNGKRIMHQGDEMGMELGIAMLAFRNNSEQANPCPVYFQMHLQ
jgi:hypothetical protein